MFVISWLSWFYEIQKHLPVNPQSHLAYSSDACGVPKPEMLYEV